MATLCVCWGVGGKYMYDPCNLESHVLVEINAIITTCCLLQILDVSDINCQWEGVTSVCNFLHFIRTHFSLCPLGTFKSSPDVPSENE